MKRSAPPKLALHRETLRTLSYDSLFKVLGGGPTAATTCCSMAPCTTGCSATAGRIALHPPRKRKRL